MSDDCEDLRQELTRLKGQLDAERKRRRDLETTVDQLRESVDDLGRAFERLAEQLKDQEGR